MHIPLLSAVTLVAEILVTVAVYWIIIKAWRTGRFMRVFAFCVLGYEFLFNISYMVSREVKGEDAGPLDPYQTALGAFHGIFSLVMFVALIAFFLFAARGYRRGGNWFAEKRPLTIAFMAAWGLSILSGILLFVSLYVH